MKRTALFFTVLCFCLTVAWADQPSKTVNEESIELTVPRMALALLEDGKSGPITLLGSDFQQHEFAFVPADVTVVAAYDSPVLTSVSLPKDKHRTNLLVSAGSEYAWTQVPSSAPYRMTGSYSFFLTSAALPPPGQMRIRWGIPDSQQDGQPSTVVTSRFRDPAHTFGLDEKLLAFLVKGNFPTLTDEQAQQTTHALLQSNVTIEMKVQVRIQSVEEFDVSNAYLQVWGD